MSDNKTIKVLRIITLTLSLMLLVFALAKKVGLCASDSSNTVSSFPLPVGSGWGNNFTSNDYNTIVTNITDLVLSQNDRDFPSVDTILLYDVDSDFYYFTVFSTTDFSVTLYGSTFDYLTDHFTLYSHVVGSNWGGQSTCRVSKSTLVADNWNYNTNSVSVAFSSFLTSSPAGGFVFPYGNFSYPSLFYTVNDLTYNGVTYFSPAPSHGQGGSLTDYSEEVENFIDSNVNDVDVSDPSNTSNVPSWLQKILSGIGTLNNTVGGGFSLIKNLINNILGAITDFSDSVIDRFNSLIGKVDSILGSLNDNTTESDLYDAWVDAYEDSYIYAFIDEFSVVETGLKNIANTQAASNVSFTFSLPSFNVPTVSGSGSVNALANHNSVTVGFNWYTLPRFSNGDSIRDRIWLPFSAFLVMGFCWRLFAKIPSILGGQSGLSDGVHKTIELSNIYANRVN